MGGVEIKYVEIQLNQFVRNLLSSGIPDNEYFIHEYRIAAKRIQTIIRLIQRPGADNRYGKHPGYRQIRRAFKRGGEFRETAINLALLDRTEAHLNYRFRSFRKFLREKIKKAGKKHEKFLARFPKKSYDNLKKRIREDFKKLSPGMIDSVTEDLMQSSVYRIRELITANELSKRLHQARKIIKDIKYVFELRSLKVKKFGNTRITLQQITVLEDHIGLWHDWLVFQQNLSAFLCEMRKEQLRDIRIAGLHALIHRTLGSVQKEICGEISRKFGRDEF